MSAPEPIAWLDIRADRVRIRLYVQPRASRTEITGTHGDALRIRVAAPPVDGEANQELLRFLAKKLGVPKSSLQLVQGETARTKVVEIENVSTGDVVRALQTRKAP